MVAQSSETGVGVMKHVCMFYYEKRLGKMETVYKTFNSRVAKKPRKLVLENETFGIFHLTLNSSLYFLLGTQVMFKLWKGLKIILF